MCNLARRSYIKNLVEELKENNNPKPFWSFVKSSRKGTNNLVSLLVDGVTLTDDLGIAQSMSQFYPSVFTSEDCFVTSKLSNIYCSVNEIEKLLKNLNSYKSPGPDGLSPRILSECASALSPSGALINKSFALGQLPSKWKRADITPLFKKGSKKCRNNYRQISLTSIVCKLAEQIVKRRIMDFWGEANVFNPNQFAYMKGRSTVTQLLSCFNDSLGKIS